MQMTQKSRLVAVPKDKSWQTCNYVIPFQALLPQVGVGDQLKNDTILFTKDQLLALIRNLLSSVPFDEVWYKKAYPDVAQAIETGEIKSAKEHFITDGYFEGRWPGPIKVDEKYYTSTYPDVAERHRKWGNYFSTSSFRALRVSRGPASLRH